MQRSLAVILAFVAFFSTSHQAALAAAPRFKDQVIRIDLSRDIDDLDGISGRYTQGYPVLGLRIENWSKSERRNQRRRTFPVLYKPKLSVNERGKLVATVEDGRFAIDLSEQITRPYVQDRDATGRFFWIVPDRFGRTPSGRPWRISQNLFQKFAGAAVGNTRRRVAEDFLLEILRNHRFNQLARGYPKGERVPFSALLSKLETRAGVNCKEDRTNDICLLSEVVALHEVGGADEFISDDAFRIGDALGGSGPSAGIRQLDFGTTNPQANRVVRELLPNSVGASARRGYGYRRPYRDWTIDELNQWYAVDGYVANERLSTGQAKMLLINYHVEYLIDQASKTRRRIDDLYPHWSLHSKQVAALLASDLENVTGHVLLLSGRERGLCDIFSNRTKRRREPWSNYGAAVYKRSRMIASIELLNSVLELDGIEPDLECLTDLWAD